MKTRTDANHVTNMVTPLFLVQLENTRAILLSNEQWSTQQFYMLLFISHQPPIIPNVTCSGETGNKSHATLNWFQGLVQINSAWYLWSVITTQIDRRIGLYIFNLSRTCYCNDVNVMSIKTCLLFRVGCMVEQIQARVLLIPKSDTSCSDLFCVSPERVTNVFIRNK